MNATTQHALETYEKTIRNCLPEEYPEWVAEVKHCLETGDLLEGFRWMPFVYDVLDELRGKGTKISMSDSK